MTSRTPAPSVVFESILERIVADLPQGQGPPELFLDPTFADPDHRDSTPDVSDAVVDIGGSRTRIGLENGSEQGCLVVMSAVQDAVIDRTGRPWPEVLDKEGTTIGVLDVDLLPDGSAGWTLRGDRVGPVGRLVAACTSRGWWVRT